MKTTRFLFALISFGALTHGEGFAGEPAPRAADRAPSERHPPVLNKSAAAAKDDAAAKKTERPRGQAVLSTILKPSTAPPLHLAPNRGPGTAIIGGPATSSKNSSAVINGTGIRPKP